MSFGLFVHDFDVKGKLFDGDITVANNALANKQYVLDAVAAGGGDWLASVLSELSTAPSSPSDGDRYLVGSSPSGWGSSNVDPSGAAATVAENDVVEYDSANTRWVVYSPSLGSHVFVEGGSTNAGNALIYTSSGWVVTANATGALVASNNLSDLPNVTTARTNLGLGDLAVQDNVDLASDVTGQLPVANGGTGASSAADARSNLGLGSIATQAADSVSITGGSITGITDLAVADGGTGASDAAGARSNLGAQAQNDLLDDISGLTIADGTFLVGDANGDIVAESGATARTSLGLGTAAVKNVGTSREQLVQIASNLSTFQLLSVETVDQTTLTFSNPGSNWNYLMSGSNWTGPNSSAGTVVSISGDSSSGTAVISFSTGSGSDFSSSGGDSWSTSGYTFTTASASSDSVTGLKTNTQAEARSKIGDANTTDSSSSAAANKGVAAFDSEFFTTNSGFVSLNVGIDGDDLMQAGTDITAGHLVKAQTLQSYSATSNAATSYGDSTVTTATDVTGAAAGQKVTFSSGYTFTLASAPVVDPNNSSQYIMTMTSSTNLNYANASSSGTSFTIAGGDSFGSAGVAGTAANKDVATSDGTSAQGKVLVVSSGATLSANDLLAIDSSGNIVAGSAGNQGTVTSIDLEAQDGSTSSAITTSGSIGVVGTGAISTSINSSNELEIAVAAASTSATGTVQLANGSNYSGGTYVPGLAISSGGDLGQNKFVTLNGSAQIEFFTPDHFDIDGPIVKSCSGIGSSISMPSTVGALEGAYVVNDSSASSDVSVSLPTSVSSDDLGATVTFKVHDLNGNKLRVSGGTVTGGARMLIDGANFVDLDQARQSVTLHLSAVLGSDSQSVDALCWSII